MTAGWAALNTLRERNTHPFHCPAGGSITPSVCTCGRDTALALVQTALEAADGFIETMGKHHETGEPRGYTYASNGAAVALAAALRAVREGQ